MHQFLHTIHIMQLIRDLKINISYSYLAIPPGKSEPYRKHYPPTANSKLESE